MTIANAHPVVSRQQWLADRKKLMAREKELTRLGDQIARDRPSTLVLAGRCYERESVAYKAVDGIIDALSEWLKDLPEAEAKEILPPNVGLLERAFPVLGKVPAIAAARALATELCITERAHFIEADLYDAPQAVPGSFDLVFVNWGAINWLPDIRRWAEIVAHFLKSRRCTLLSRRASMRTRVR